MAAVDIKSRAREPLRPLAQLLVDIGVHPTAVTFIGLLLSALAGLSLASGHFLRAGVVLVLAGVCDIIDGDVARASDRATHAGAFLDSTIDRYSEVLVLLGALYYYLVRSPGGPEPVTACVIFVALSGSLLVSYTRARAEAIGVDCKVGLTERPERLIIIILGALFGAWTFRVAMWALAVLANVTALQRVRHVLRRVGSGR